VRDITAHGGDGGTSIALFGKLGIKRSLLVSFRPRPLYPWKRAPSIYQTGSWMAPVPVCRLSRTEHRQSRFNFLLLRRPTYSPPNIALKHFQSTLFLLWETKFRTHTTHKKKKRVSIPNPNLPLISLWKEIFIWHETMQCGTRELALRQNLLLPTWRQKNCHLLQFVEFIAHIYITILLRILVTNIKIHHIWLKISTFWPVTPCHWVSGSCTAWGIKIVCNSELFAQRHNITTY